MNLALNILISGIVALGSFIGAYKYLPLNTFDSAPLLGSTITTIAGSDTLSASRSVINTNFTNLNTGKFELSDWYATTSAAQLTTLAGLTSAASLATIGTITTGTWSGTAIAVAKGGTGTTSPSTYMVMLGNGSNGLTMASSTGTTGQLLTSNGAGAYPSFQTQTATPTGSITAYASTTAPTGWLLADGTSYATADYSALFAVIGYSYGGSGANFNVPDLKGRNILMASTTANIGQTGGESNHTLTTAEAPAHTHTTPYGASGSGSSSKLVGGTQVSDVGDFNTGSTGGGTAHNVLDPYFVLQYIIKY